MTESMKIRFKQGKEIRSATRFKVNPNWTYRGDNTKYKDKK